MGIRLVTCIRRSFVVWFRQRGKLCDAGWQAARPVASPGVTGALSKNKCEMKPPLTDPRLELAALAMLAALGCGLALSQDNLLFAVIFGAACAASIFEEIRRFP
jgi:hypothetical protein